MRRRGGVVACGRSLMREPSGRWLAGASPRTSGRSALAPVLGSALPGHHLRHRPFCAKSNVRSGTATSLATLGTCPTSNSSPRSSRPATSPRAIERLTDGLVRGPAPSDPPRRDRDRQDRDAGVDHRPAHNKPTLVLAHNKTLAAQLYAEFREFFPNNAVEYFVSYFDYYQPEAYLPRSDTYIEKDSSRNDEIDRLRHAATHALFERRDVIIVASVSCIYGLGAPVDYGATVLKLRTGGKYRRDAVLRHLVDLQYQRNDQALGRARFRVRGDTLELQPASEEFVVRVEFFGDEVERITELDPLTGELLARAQGDQRVPGDPLRHPGRQAQGSDRRHRGRDGGPGRRAGGGGPGARGRSTAPAHDVRPGDAPRARLLLRRRELLAAPRPA